jgi:hypothetical protein
MRPFEGTKDLLRDGFLIQRAAVRSLPSFGKAQTQKVSNVNRHPLDEVEPGVDRVHAAYSRILGIRPLTAALRDSGLLKIVFGRSPVLNYSLWREPLRGFGDQPAHKDSTSSLSLEQSEIICFVPLDPCCSENGGTLFYPGSHRSQTSNPPSDPICPSLEPGDVVWMLPTLTHKGQINKLGSRRRLLALSFAQGRLHPTRADDDSAFIFSVPHSQEDLELLGLSKRLIK